MIRVSNCTSLVNCILKQITSMSKRNSKISAEADNRKESLAHVPQTARESVSQPKQDRPEKPKAGFYLAILVLGSQGVGKTSIVKRYIGNIFDKEQKPTIGVDTVETKMELKNKTQHLEIIDVSGQSKFRGLIPEQLKRVQAVVLVYDITDKKSFTDLDKYVPDITKYCAKNTFLFVVGNKTDQSAKRQIGLEDGAKFVGIDYVKQQESSAANPSNIATIIQTIVQWSQIKVIPGSVPSQTEKLLIKLNQTDVVKTSINTNKQMKVLSSSLSIAQMNGSAVNTMAQLPQSTPNKSVELPQEHGSQSPKAKAATQEEYFEKLWKKNNLQFKARRVAQQTLNHQELEVYTRIHGNKLTIQEDPRDLDHSFNEEPEHAKLVERLMHEQRYKELDKLRKEISHNLVMVEDHIERLSFNQIDELKQAEEVKKTLTNKLISLEQNMTLLRCEQLLKDQPPNFSTKKVQYRTLDESMLQKQNVHLITQPEHFKEQEEFITKVVAEWENLEKKREKRVKRLEDQRLNGQKELDELRKRQQEKRNEQKREQIGKFLKDLEEQQNKRKEDHQASTSVVKRLLHTKILPEINEVKQDKLFKNDVLQARKEKLKEIRDIHQPIRKDTLDEREAKYEEIRKNKAEQREQKAQERAKLKFQASYLSQNYLKAKDETKHIKHYKEDLNNQLKERVQATQKFVHEVREGHAPQIDERKVQELEELKQKLTQRPDVKGYVEIAYRVKKKGAFFDQEGKFAEREIDEQHYEDLRDYQSEDEGIKDKGKRYLETGGRINKKHIPSKNKYEDVNTSLPEKTEERLPPKKIDYMKQVHSDLHLKKKDVLKDWEKLQNEGKLPSTLLEQKIVNEAKQLESEAIRKEQILRAKSMRNQELLQESGQVDDLLVSSIKAKLTVLDKAKQASKQPEKIFKKQLPKTKTVQSIPFV